MTLEYSMKLDGDEISGKYPAQGRSLIDDMFQDEDGACEIFKSEFRYCSWKDLTVNMGYNCKKARTVSWSDSLLYLYHFVFHSEPIFIERMHFSWREVLKVSLSIAGPVLFLVPTIKHFWATLVRLPFNMVSIWCRRNLNTLCRTILRRSVRTTTLVRRTGASGNCEAFQE